MNKLKSKSIAVIAILVLLLLGIGAFSVHRLCQPQVIKLGVFVGSPWGVPDPYTFEFLDSAIAKFEAENSGVKVEYVSGIQRDDYSEWLAGNILTGDAPDVFMVLPEDFSTLQKVGALRSLDMVMKKDSSFNPEDFYEGAYTCGSSEGVQYALPMETAPDIMFVNKTLLESEGIEVPDENWTWDQLYYICKKVTKDTDGNGVIDQFGIYNYNWEHAFVTNGVAYFDEEGTACDIQGENAQQAVTFINELNDLGQGAVITATDFDTGKVAFMPLTLAEYRTYKPYPWSIKKYSAFDWECIPLPRGPQGDNVSRMNTLLVGMNSRTKKTALSWELMKTFCYDEQIQNDIYKYRGGGAVLKSILAQEDQLLIENQILPEDSSINIMMIENVLEKGKADYTFDRVAEAKRMLGQGIDDIVENDKNPQIALKSLQREIDRFLER